MCCAGCRAVAQTIVAMGMENYYKFRTGVAPTAAEPVPELLERLKHYDLPAVAERFVSRADDDICEASFILEGITCAACVWLNERYLSAQPGVVGAQINYTRHLARVRWRRRETSPAKIIAAVGRLGYTAHPYDPGRGQDVIEKERRGLLRRIGVAGLFGMQVMTLAVALYTGAWWGMEPRLAALLEWASMILAAPVLLFAARPFFANARNDLRRGTVGMDVPVSLGVAIAFCASVWAVATGEGEVYFDSVVMFTFFLLVARFFELTARRHSADAAARVARLTPTVATRLRGGGDGETVAAAALRPGDVVLVKPGETVPADGVVIAGASRVDESLLTGESAPARRGVGDRVIGGSVNTQSALKLRVEAVGKGAVLSLIMDMMARAGAEKPAVARAADKAAAWFTPTILALAAVAGVYWHWRGAADYLGVMVSVLVVACPCALSLATPTAMSAAAGRLSRRGLLTLKGHAIETLAKADHFVFDKTGTLTEGDMRLVSCRVAPDGDKTRLLGVAAALETASEHFIAQAIIRAAGGQTRVSAQSNAISVENHPGRGLSGVVAGERWWLGNRDFVRAAAGVAAGQFDFGRDTDNNPDNTGRAATEVYLARRGRLCAVMRIGDRMRAGADTLVQNLTRMGKKVSVVSGDNPAAVDALTRVLRVKHRQAAALPQDKLAAIAKLQRRGDTVAMVGDGINDAPVLAQAQLSIALFAPKDIANGVAKSGAARLASTRVDMVLLSERLDSLSDGVAVSARAMRVVRQNIFLGVVV